MVMEFTFALEFTFSSQRNYGNYRENCNCSHPAKKQRGANSYTSRDAQKQQNAVSRRVTRDFRAEYARKHLAEHSRVNSNS